MGTLQGTLGQEGKTLQREGGEAGSRGPWTGVRGGEMGPGSAFRGPWTRVRGGEMGPGSAFRVSIPAAGEGVSMCAYAYGCTRTCSYKPVYMCRRLQIIAVHDHKCLLVGLLFRPAFGEFGKGFWAGSLALLWSRDRWSNGDGAQRRVGSREGGGLVGVAQEEEAFLSCLLGGATETPQPSQKTGEQQLCI